MKNGKQSAGTYVYCLVQAPKAPSLQRAPRGLAGTGALRLLDAGRSLWIVAADAPLALYAKQPIDAGLQNLKWVSACAIAHERVVEHFIAAGTVIPLKLFTIFNNDARALAHIQATRKQVEEVIARVARCQEWGVRMSLNAPRAGRAAKAKGSGIAPGSSPGTRFLFEKKQQQDFARALRAQASAEAETTFQRLSKLGRDSLRLPTIESENGGRVILDAAFLVPQAKAKRFQDAVARLAARKAIFDLTLTGPWPPYNFVAKMK